MPVASVDDLIQTLGQGPLLDGTQQVELQRDLRTRFADPRSLARELLQRGWLTPYQVNQVFLGRGSELLIGPYLVLERLGEGGTGQVFKARHTRMRRVVAVKLIRPELTADAEVVKRFYREVQVISQLAHPNIVHAFDAGPVGQTHMLIMEYVEGIDLARLVKQKGPLPVEQALSCIHQAALGLQHAHEKGLIHRDVKPSNLLLTQPAQGPGVVKLLDLGLARLHRNADGELTSTLTPAGPVTMGTPDYLAPEQAINFHQVDIRADIYGLGCTLFFLLTGRPPFPGGSLAQKLLQHQQAEPPRLEPLRPGLPPTLEPVLRKMLAKRPEDRPQTPAEVAAAMAELQGSRTASPDGCPVAVAALVEAEDGSRPATWPTASLATAAVPVAVPFDAAAGQASDSGRTVSLGPLPPITPARAAVASLARRRLAVAGAVGVASLCLLGLLARWLLPGSRATSRPATGRSAVPARLAHVQGQVYVLIGEARVPARTGAEVAPGQRIQTIGPASQARLTLGAHVTLELGPDTVVGELVSGAPTGGRHIEVVALGLLRAEVKATADGLLTWSGPRATGQVISGRFALAATADTAWVRVDEGEVHVTPTGDRQPVLVPAGHFVAVRAGGAPAVRPLRDGRKVLDDFQSAEFTNWWPYNSDATKPKGLVRTLVTPGKVGRHAMRIDYDVSAGHGVGLGYQIDTAQDWSRYRAFHFWFYGNNTATRVGLQVNDDRFPDTTGRGQLSYEVLDDFTGWREFVAPWTTFARAGFAPGEQVAPFNLGKVSRINVGIAPGKGWFQLDHVELLEHELLQ